MSKYNNLYYQLTHLGISLQVVEQHIDTDGEVTSVKGIGTIPALRTKLASLYDHGVEIAQ